MKDRLVLTVQRVLAYLSKLVLGPHVQALITKTDNGLFAVNPEDLGVGGRLRMTGKYGLAELERLAPHLTSDSRVLIVGAHVGTLAIPLSRLCREVVAIEANPHTFELLRMNILLNAAINCRAVHIAASDENGKLDFLLSRTNSGGSKRVPKIKQFVYYSDYPETISVDAVRLDDYLDEHPFDVVVMDIEGSEYFALRGMQRILSCCKLLVVEFLPHHLKNVSGVSVGQFLTPIQPHFSKLYIPSRQAEADAPAFVAALTRMYELGHGDEGIMFSKP